MLADCASALLCLLGLTGLLWLMGSWLCAMDSDDSDELNGEG